jgi:hypothetical protein
MAAGASVRLMNRGTGFALVAAAAAVTAAAAMRWWDQSNKVIQGPEWTASYRRFTELGPWYDLTEHVNGKPGTPVYGPASYRSIWREKLRRRLAGHA